MTGDRRIDLASWPRKEIFDLFGQGYSPYYDVTVSLEVTKPVKLCKRKGLSFYRTMIYALTRAVNRIPAFLVRIRPEGVFEIPWASPSYTVAGQEGLFGILSLDYIPGESLSAFCLRAAEKEQNSGGIQADEGERDDLIFISCVPWFSYTALSQERPLSPDDAFPRFLWGRYEEKEGRYILPFSMELNHRLLDGGHIRQLLEELEKVFDEIEREEWNGKDEKARI